MKIEMSLVIPRQFSDGSWPTMALEPYHNDDYAHWIASTVHSALSSFITGSDHRAIPGMLQLPDVQQEIRIVAAALRAVVPFDNLNKVRGVAKCDTPDWKTYSQIVRFTFTVPTECTSDAARQFGREEVTPPRSAVALRLRRGLT